MIKYKDIRDMHAYIIVSFLDKPIYGFKTFSCFEFGFRLSELINVDISEYMLVEIPYQKDIYNCLDSINKNTDYSFQHEGCCFLTSFAIPDFHGYCARYVI